MEHDFLETCDDCAAVLFGVFMQRDAQSLYMLAGLLRNGDTVTSVGLKSVPASTMVKLKPFAS